MHQMVCFTDPSGKELLEIVWERAGNFKKYLADDKMIQLSTTIY